MCLLTVASECSFVESEYSVHESSAVVTITVQKTTDMSSVRNSCVIATEAGTAMAGENNQVVSSSQQNC